jgi:SAM-dependent methyltransferase
MSNADAATIDQQYFEVVHPGGLAERLLLIARREIYKDFIRICRPNEKTTILDVGVSDVVKDASNFFEQAYPHPGQITAAGIGTGQGVAESYGLGRFVHIEPNAPLPFEDKAFDVVISNAVIEHVGSRENQMRFFQELSRVARQVFLTAPNRYFPVEHHTAIPLFHYWRPTFSLACKGLHKDEWLDPENLILTSIGDLRRLSAAAKVGYTGLALGPFSSNLFLHCAD